MENKEYIDNLSDSLIQVGESILREKNALRRVENIKKACTKFLKEYPKERKIFSDYLVAEKKFGPEDPKTLKLLEVWRDTNDPEEDLLDILHANLRFHTSVRIEP